jgi:hypothetical protein
MVSHTLSISCLAAFVLSLRVVRISAQESEASATGSIAPAATLVSTESAAGVPLFNAEAVQLTEEVIAQLAGSDDPDIAKNAHLFSFDDSPSVTPVARAQRIRRAARCKTYPGDFLWPSNLVWDVFDRVLGGALEPIVPLASVCYKNSQYKNYDAAKCSALTAAWGLDKTQYVCPYPLVFII